MALPKLNSSPIYEVKVPSTGQSLRYRPYLVKEEKVMIMAFESGDQKQTLKAIMDTIDACVQDDINVNDLATFDVEYMFTQIRSKSAGEKATVLLKCEECGTEHQYQVDLSKIDVEIGERESFVELTNDITVEMRFPPYSAVVETDLQGDQLKLGLDMVAASISAIIVKDGLEEERMDAKDVSKKELMDFVESMTTEQFERITNYIGDLPAMKHDAEYKCLNCGHENVYEMKGISDFLS